MAYTDPSTLTWQTEEKPTSAKMNQATNDQFLALLPDGVAAASWTPTLKGSSSDPGVSSTTGREYQIGPLQFCWATFVLSSGGSGTYYVALPTAASGVAHSTSDGKGQAVGSFLFRDDSPGWVRGGAVYLDTASQVFFVFDDTGDENGLLTESNIRVAASGDVLSFFAIYPVA